MNATGACKDCKFFLDVGDKEGLGECHRNPPRTDVVLLGVQEQGPNKGQPIFNRVVVPNLTPFHGWCGEFAKGLVIPPAGSGKINLSR
jgi:hypothetical protein